MSTGRNTQGCSIADAQVWRACPWEELGADLSGCPWELGASPGAWIHKTPREAAPGLPQPHAVPWQEAESSPICSFLGEDGRREGPREVAL